MSAAVPFRLDRGMNHDVARTVGSIRERDWVLLFRVPMPEGGIRRMEVRGSKLHGRFGNRWDCEKALDTIREDCLRGDELYQVLERYRLLSSIHTNFGGLWGLFVRAELDREADGEVTASRVRNLRSYVTAGHLKPLWRLPVRMLDYKALNGLRRALRAKGLRASLPR